MANDASTELAIASDVLRHEAQALNSLAATLGDGFLRIVDTLYCTSGHIATTGIGKSGHVARKVAATFSSTGSPAYFIHPVEASHGDLGVLSADDCLLAFSNSGNSLELGDLVLYAARRGMPLIGVTRDANSLLGRHASHLLLLPPCAEADPLECAPTTSSIMQMALGDALAIALMRRRGCTLEEFHRTHPGGHLGSKLLIVDEIMRTGAAMPILPPAAPMPEVILLMTGAGLGVAGIVESDRLVGIITDGDLRRHINTGIMDKSAQEIMHKNPITVESGTLAMAALHLMQERKIAAVFVCTEAGTPIGFLNVHDCLRAGLK